MKNLQEVRNVADWKWISVLYRNATTLVELCVFLSLSLFEGKKLKIDAFVEMHMYKFLENATVDFQFLCENIILL